MKKVKFTQMSAGDKADYEFLYRHEAEYASQVGERLVSALEALDDTLSGYQVTRLEHSLQTATRAYFDGADDDWVVSALLHDIGDVFAPYNHDAYAATILAPYVREQCTWTVAHHGAFQKLYYAHHVGGNPRERDQFKGHIYFDDCDYFCEYWDQRSFNPDYPSHSVDFFRPLVLAVFARDAYDPNYVAQGVRKPLYNEQAATERQRKQ